MKTTPEYALDPRGDLITKKPLKSIWIEDRKRMFRKDQVILHLDYEDGEQWTWGSMNRPEAEEFRDKLIDILAPSARQQPAPGEG